LIDKADDFLELVDSPLMTDTMRANLLQAGLAELRAEMFKIHLVLGGQDYWE